MKKLVAAVLTGVLVAGTLSTGVYAKDDDKTITVAASATPHLHRLLSVWSPDLLPYFLLQQ